MNERSFIRHTGMTFIYLKEYKIKKNLIERCNTLSALSVSLVMNKKWADDDLINCLLSINMATTHSLSIFSLCSLIIIYRYIPQHHLLLRPLDDHQRDNMRCSLACFIYQHKRGTFLIGVGFST